MAIPNFTDLPVIPLIRETRTITDPRYPDRPLTLTLEALDEAKQDAVVDLMAELQQRFTGSTATSLKALRTTSGERRRIQVSQQLCFIAARIILQQVPAEKVEDRLIPEQIFYMTATWQLGYRELREWSNDLQARYEASIAPKSAVDAATGESEGDDMGNDSGDFVDGLPLPPSPQDSPIQP